MSTLRCVGLSHRSATLAVRERLAVSLAESPALLQAVCALPGVAEAVVLSTCNRVELYVAATPGAALPDDDVLVAPLTSRIGEIELADALYRHVEREAVRHLFRVAAGLDSLVVGETQVLGQLREAYGAAAAAGTTGARLNPLFQQALASARRLHASTKIGAGRVSVAGVAVDLARRVFGALDGVSALLVGTGDTGRLTLRHLSDSGIGSIQVASRDPARAAALAAETGATAVPGAFSAGAADAPLAAADLVVTAVGDGAQVLDAADLRTALRRRRQRPIVVIDLGVPRNVPAAVARVDNVFYYDVDALEAVVQSNLRGRSAEVAACEGEVASSVEAYWNRHGDPDVERSVGELSRQLTALGDAEIAGLLDSLGDLPDDVRDRVRRAARRLVSRLLHAPLSELNRATVNGGAGDLTNALQRLFQLDAGHSGDAPESEAPSSP